MGYSNQLVSEKLAALDDDEEPGLGSDEWAVWDGDYQFEEIENAELEVRDILQGKRDVLVSLANELLARRDLNKDEIQAIIGQ
jgi:hypothetical protein